VIAIILPGIASKRKPRADFRYPASTFGDDHEVMTTKDNEHHDANRKIAHQE
jgi:hypothetical protein